MTLPDDLAALVCSLEPTDALLELLTPAMRALAQDAADRLRPDPEATRRRLQAMARSEGDDRSTATALRNDLPPYLRALVDRALPPYLRSERGHWQAPGEGCHPLLLGAATRFAFEALNVPRADDAPR